MKEALLRFGLFCCIVSFGLYLGWGIKCIVNHYSAKEACVECPVEGKK